MKIKAISLWEPWASLMRSGQKTIETRSWSTSYRGPLLICASKHWDLSCLTFLRNPYTQAALRMLPEFSDKDYVSAQSLHRGMAVCLVDLVKCRFTGKSIYCTDRTWVNSLPGNEIYFGDFSALRYGLITENLRTFDPFPVKGRQGLFDVELPHDLRWVA